MVHDTRRDHREVAQTAPLATGIPLPRNPRTHASVMRALTMAGWGGVGAALAAGALYAVATFATQHTSGIRPYPMTLIQCVVGAAILLPFAHSLDWSSSSWKWIAVMGIVHTGLLYSILDSTARVLSTITLAALSFVNPAVAVLVDVMVYGHVHDGYQLLRIGVIATATLAMTLRNR